MERESLYLAKDSFKAAKRASGAVLKATKIALESPNIRSFCLTRPPGHHAMCDGIDPHAGGYGFCLLNHVAIAAASLEKQNKIAIVDFDIHHGNGTEEFVLNQEIDNIKYFSIHILETFEDNSDNDFFPGSGKETNSSKVMNVPIKPMWIGGSGRVDFITEFRAKIVHGVQSFAPDLLLMSTGFDGAFDDEGNVGTSDEETWVHGMDLKAEDYFSLTESLLKVIPEHCGVVSVLEGGYGKLEENDWDYSTLRECAKQHCKALLMQ